MRRSPILRAATLIAASVGTILCSQVAEAQIYPTKAVRLVVPFAAGGPSDVVARTIAQKLGEALAQPVLVENKPGAGGNIGTDFVAKAAPDGYTIVMGVVGPVAVNPSLFGNLPYNPVSDFAPITQAVSITNLLVVRSDFPVNTVRDLIEHGRRHPGRLSAGTGGAGTAGHMSSELFRAMAKIDMVVIPYKGAAPAVNDLLGGQVSMVFEGMPSTVAHIKAGKLKAIAVTTSKRSSLLPNVPTIGESGLQGYETSNWYGFLAPARTPKPIIDRLHNEIVKILATPDVKEKLAAQGAEVIANTPQEFADNIKTDIEKWRRVVKETGAKVE